MFPTTITWHVPYNYYLSNKHIWFIRVESFDLFIGLHAISIPDYLDLHQMPLCVVDWVISVSDNWTIFQQFHGEREQVTFPQKEEDDGVSFVLDQQAYLELYSDTHWKQLSIGRLVVPFG